MALDDAETVLVECEVVFLPAEKLLSIRLRKVFREIIPGLHKRGILWCGDSSYIQRKTWVVLVPHHDMFWLTNWDTVSRNSVFDWSES